MKIISLAILLAPFFFYKNIEHRPCFGPVVKNDDSISYMFGNFTDDYDIVYTISHSLWIQQPGTKYHILKWNKKEQYCIARNDDKNPTDPGLYSRIDYMQFENMKPWLWGFCYTVYKAANDSVAEHAVSADRNNPRKGCNGYPFSRMKKIE